MMMVPFAGLDRWMIEHLFEPLERFLDRSFGSTGPQLGRVFLVVWTAAAVSEAATTLGVMACIIAGAALGLTPLRFWTITQIETARTGTANPEKHHPVSIFFRVLLVCCLPGSMVLITTGAATPLTAGNIAYLIHLYLCACDAPPPVETEVTEARLA